MAHPDQPNGSFRALRERDFALLWSGQTVSSLGDGIFTIALALVTLRVDHSPSGLAYVFAARAVPSVLLALVGGVVVDRAPRRLVMLVSDLLRGATVGLIAFIVATGTLRLWELIVMAAIFGGADSFFGPASMSIMPELLSDDLLISGNALGQMSNQLTQGLIGPAIGGFVVAAIGSAWSFGFDAMSFAFSALCLLAMRPRTRPPSSGQTPWHDAKEGLRYMRRQRWLLYTMVGAALANFFGTAMIVLLPVFVRQTLHASALSLGLVYAAAGAAGILGSLLVARMGRPRRLVTVTWLAYAVGGVGNIALAFAPDIAVTALLNAVFLGFIIYGDVLWTAMLQVLVPREFLGRVSSLIYLFAFSLGPLGLLFGGTFAAAVGVREAIFTCGVVATALCLAVLVAPGVRDPERDGRLEEAPVIASEEVSGPE